MRRHVLLFSGVLALARNAGADADRLLSSSVDARRGRQATVTPQSRPPSTGGFFGGLSPTQTAPAAATEAPAATATASTYIKRECRGAGRRGRCSTTTTLGWYRECGPWPRPVPGTMRRPNSEPYTRLSKDTNQAGPRRQHSLEDRRLSTAFGSQGVGRLRGHREPTAVRGRRRK